MSAPGCAQHARVVIEGGSRVRDEFVEVVAVAVACADGTVDLQRALCMPAETLAGVLRELLAMIEAHPDGHIEERREPSL